MNKIINILLVLSLFMGGCESEDATGYVPEEQMVSEDTIAAYFQKNFQDMYGCAVRWRWVDKYVSIDYVVTPAQRKVLIPTGEMIKKFWIEPFLLESGAGGDFIRANFPPEIVCIGSPLRNADGTTTLGYADAGVRITLTELNYLNMSDLNWVKQQLHTIHHEFTHIIHQTYKMPQGFNEITPDNYTGQAWNDIYAKAQKALMDAGIEQPTQEEIEAQAEKIAIAAGMLTPYGTSSEFEDFAEVVSLYLLTDPYEYSIKFLEPDPSQPELTAGKGYIRQKTEMAINYYKVNFSIDLTHLRDIIQERLNSLQ